MRHKNKVPKEPNSKRIRKDNLCRQARELEKEIARKAKKNRMQGTVVYYSFEKGIGFIKQDDVPEENLFFHHSKCVEVPPVHSRVKYEIGEGRKGPEAVNVSVI